MTLRRSISTSCLQTPSQEVDLWDKLAGKPSTSFGDATDRATSPVKGPKSFVWSPWEFPLSCGQISLLANSCCDVLGRLEMSTPFLKKARRQEGDLGLLVLSTDIGLSISMAVMTSVSLASCSSPDRHKGMASSSACGSTLICAKGSVPWFATAPLMVVSFNVLGKPEVLVCEEESLLCLLQAHWYFRYLGHRGRSDAPWRSKSGRLSVKLPGIAIVSRSLSGSRHEVRASAQCRAMGEVGLSASDCMFSSSKLFTSPATLWQSSKPSSSLRSWASRKRKHESSRLCMRRNSAQRMTSWMFSLLSNSLAV